MGSGTGYHESAGESESILFFSAWGPRAGICSVCGSSLGILCFVVCIIISLIIWFCMSGRRGMHDTELLGEKRFCWAWSIE